MSDNKSEPANPTTTPRFPMRGPGRPYIIFGVVTTLAIGAAMLFNTDLR